MLPELELSSENHKTACKGHESLLSKIMAAARENSSATMWRFIESGVTFDSDNDEEEDDDDDILHFDFGLPALVNNPAPFLQPRKKWNEANRHFSRSDDERRYHFPVLVTCTRL